MFADILRDVYNIHVNIHLEAEFQQVNRHDGGIQTSNHFEEFIKELERIDKEIDGRQLLVMATETLRFALDERGIDSLEKRLKRINPNIRLETLKEMGQNKQQAARANEEKDRHDRATEQKTSHIDALNNSPIHPECVETFNSIATKRNEINHILSSKSGVNGLDQWMRNVMQQRNTVGHGLPTNQAFLQNPSNFSGLSIDEMVDEWIQQVKWSGADPGNFESMRESAENSRRIIGEDNLSQDQFVWNLAAIDVIECIDRKSVGIQQSCGRRDTVTLEMTREFEIIALDGPLRDIIATSPNRHFQSNQRLKDLYYGLLRKRGIYPHFSKYFGRVNKSTDTKPTSWDTADLSFKLESEKKGEFKDSNDQKKKAIAIIPVELNYGPFANESVETIRKIVYVANKLSRKRRDHLLAEFERLSIGKDDEDEYSVNEDDERKLPPRRDRQAADSSEEENEME